MSRLDPAFVADLAARLDLSPRQLLALAGRIALVPGAVFDDARLEVELARVHTAGAATAAAADLAVLGYAGYALDDIDRGLDIVWSEPRAAGT